jgi:hypothetical protein
MPRFRKSSPSTKEFFEGKHRYEHWYRDNTVYFITSRCKDHFLAFASEEAKGIFWDRFLYWSTSYGFVPFVTTLIGNHYHTLGYLKQGKNLGPMMQKIHGSVAKLVNDLLPVRLKPFWRDAYDKDYFDGCIRDVLQLRRAYRYTLTQAERHKLCRDWRKYRHTIVNVELEAALKRATELKVFLEEVPYARYERNRERRGVSQRTDPAR